MTDPIVVSAPGKLMIAGEYAVLEGAEAVVAAVGRRAYARARAAARSRRSRPEVAGRARGRRAPGRAPCRRAHARRQRAAGQEAASSASARPPRQAAAAAGAVFAAHGHDVNAPQVARADPRRGARRPPRGRTARQRRRRGGGRARRLRALSQARRRGRDARARRGPRRSSWWWSGPAVPVRTSDMLVARAGAGRARPRRVPRAHARAGRPGRPADLGADRRATSTRRARVLRTATARPWASSARPPDTSVMTDTCERTASPRRAVRRRGQALGCRRRRCRDCRVFRALNAPTPSGPAVPPRDSKYYR